MFCTFYFTCNHDLTHECQLYHKLISNILHQHNIRHRIIWQHCIKIWRICGLRQQWFWRQWPTSNQAVQYPALPDLVFSRTIYTKWKAERTETIISRKLWAVQTMSSRWQCCHCHVTVLLLITSMYCTDTDTQTHTQIRTEKTDWHICIQTQTHSIRINVIIAVIIIFVQYELNVFNY